MPNDTENGDDLAIDPIDMLDVKQAVELALSALICLEDDLGCDCPRAAVSQDWVGNSVQMCSRYTCLISVDLNKTSRTVLSNSFFFRIPE